MNGNANHKHRRRQIYFLF